MTRSPKRPAAHIQTRLVHSGNPRPRIEGAGVPPIFRSTLWESRPEDGYHDVRYPRLSNLPNHVQMGEKIADLEGGEAGLVTASGMAAISATLISIVGAADHLLIQNGVYGGTHSLVTEDLVRLGVTYDFVDGDDPADWKAKLRTNTRAFYAETISNPLLGISDLEGIAAFARAHGLVSLIDNTFASPVNFRPLEHGFDYVLHSATKYLNGHSDVIAGCVVGGAENIAAVKCKLDHFGGALDPEAAYLLGRGLKTLALRMGYQNVSALAIAEFLEGHVAVRSVRYPGLAHHPQHARAARLFDGFGGMLSFEMEAGAAAAERTIERLGLVMASASLGGVETVATRPAATTHAGLSKTERDRLGISDGLIRFSVGIEATEDLVADLNQALD
jgi:cystathionine beta-lyase/cystathionine gamma-synthase